MSNKYTFKIPFEYLDEVIVDYLLDSFKSIELYNKEMKRARNIDKKNKVVYNEEYWKKHYEDNVELMKAMAECIRHFTAPDDPRRVTVKNSRF